MKKLFFSALAVMTIVGTAFALDSSKSIWCDNPANQQTDCEIQVSSRSLSPTDGPFVEMRNCRATEGENCNQSLPTYQAD